ILTREDDAFGEEPRQDRDARPISRIPEARTQAVTREHEEDALVILGATAVAVPGEDRIDEGAVHLQRPRAALTEQPLEVAHQILDGARLDVGAPLAEHALDRLARLGELLSRDARSFGAARLGRPLRRLRRARP